jgi:TPR repeat protein
VAHSQEKIQVPVTDLPNPELNPLINPTLGRNLGRWAEVYFTSPPEKREEAVVELLRELQAETPSDGREADPDPAPPNAFRGFEAAETRLSCAECGGICAPEQRFCGMCGARLQSAAGPGASERLGVGYEREFSQPSLSGAFSGSELPSLQPATSIYPMDTRSEVSWLREKADDRFSASRGARRYAPALVALLAVGILFYAQFKPHETPSKQKAPAAANVSPTAPPQAGATQPSAPPAAPVVTNSEKESFAKQNPSSTPAEKSNPVANSATPTTAGSAPAVDTPTARPHVSAPAQPDTSSSVGNGSSELAEAESFLNGKNGSHDSAAAARLLWRAVAKENATATLLLSDLYLMGDGVPKSCDQARLLLTAAARKHVPQATEKLRNLVRSGCP